MNAGTERIKPRVLINTNASTVNAKRLTAFVADVADAIMTEGGAGYIIIDSDFGAYLRSGDKVDVPELTHTPSVGDPVVFPANTYTVERYEADPTLLTLRLDVSPATLPGGDGSWTSNFTCLAHVLFRRATVIANKAAGTANTGALAFGPAGAEVIAMASG